MRLIFYLISVLYGCFPMICADVVYCSVSGDDSNQGTREAPVRTIAKAIGMAPEVRLRRGDIFYEPIVADGVSFDAYGGGNPPVICGLKIVKSPYIWERGTVTDGSWAPSSTGNVWRIYLTREDAFNGLRTGKKSWQNNVGAVVNVDTGSMNGTRKVPSLSDLSENFDICQPYNPPSDRPLATERFEILYLYLDTDPRELPLAFTCGTNGVEIGHGAFRNIDVRYWSRHGFQLHDGVIVENVRVDGIGGGIQTGVDNWVLLGNGVERWVSPPGAFDILVRNCVISRCFDCGLTVQGRYDHENIKARNILYTGNTVFNCCQGWEGILTGPGPEDRFYDCEVSGNVFIDNGMDTGFRYFDNRFKHCQILSSSKRPVGPLLSGNLFLDGNYLCCSRTTDLLYNPQELVGNVAYLVRGQFLIGNYIGTEDVVRIPEKGSYPTVEALDKATDAAISRYRALTGDHSTRFVIVDTSDSPRLSDLKAAMKARIAAY